MPPAPLPQTPTLDEIAQQYVIEPGVAPAATLGWAKWTEGALQGAVGAAGQNAHPATLFDLASITKPIVALTTARLVARGVLSWEDEVGRWVPELADTPTVACTMAHLLSHRAGLEAHIELFAPWRARRGVRRSRLWTELGRARRSDCLGAPPPNGFPPVYSDLGYILGGEALERATGRAVDELVAAEVSEPLALDIASARQWLERGRAPSDFAPTEVVPWRGGSLQAVVHDENAWTIAGHGSAGHAGLFGSAEALLRLGVELLRALRGESSWLMTDSVGVLLEPQSTQPQSTQPQSELRLGFDGKSAGRSSAGEHAGPRTFGHLGFTGTSFWCDPEASLITVLLSNRVRPNRDNPSIRLARPRVHDALAESFRR